MEFLDSELNTENSNISADIIFNYSAGDLSNFTDKVQIDADFKNADIGLLDIKKLYSEFGKNDMIHFKTKLNGTINDFVLSDIDLTHLPKIKNLQDIVKKINNLETNKKNRNVRMKKAANAYKK